MIITITSQLELYMKDKTLNEKLLKFKSAKGMQSDHWIINFANFKVKIVVTNNILTIYGKNYYIYYILIIFFFYSFINKICGTTPQPCYAGVKLFFKR